MQAPSELAMCSDLAQQAYVCLLKMSTGSNIRTNTVLDGLGQKLGVSQIEVKGIVRELYRASLLQYTADRQDLPASGMVKMVRPEKTISLIEHEWGRALDASGMSEAARKVCLSTFIL